MEQAREMLRKKLESTVLNEQERKQLETCLQSTGDALKSFWEIQERNKEMKEHLRPMLRRIAEPFVSRWKINQALYRKYGGRVIFQQAGMEPLDAYRDLLKEQEKAGAFQILDKQYEVPFWRNFTTDSMHSFLSSEEGAKAMTTPWWLMEKKPEPSVAKPSNQSIPSPN